MVEEFQPLGKDVFCWDPEVPGFGLKVTPAGGKTYVFQYRMGGRGHATRRYSIGRHGQPWTADRAKREARRLIGEVANGRDPVAEQNADNKALTVKGLVRRFMEEHADTKTKSRTVEEYERYLRQFVTPGLGRRRVRDVSRDDVARLHHDMRGTPYQANRVLAVLSKMFNLAEKWNLRPDGSNPCRHVDRFPEKKRERYLSSRELGQLGKALAEAEKEGSESCYLVGAVRLLVLTGARLNEVLTLHWDFVDLEEKVLRLPDSKTGAKVIRLSSPALAVLEQLPRVEGNPHVIVGDRTGKHMVNIQKAWRRLRKRAGLDDLRLHDLRHSFASVGAGGGVSLTMLGALLGHSQPATTARYAHLAADPLREANDQIGSQISEALNGNARTRI